MNAFEKVKKAVLLEKYAGEYTELMRSGGVLVGRCPLPDHEDQSPSFTVWTGNDSWWCFGCSRGSDIFNLYFYLEGCSDLWETVVGLSIRYSIELPERPPKWYAQQKTKTDICNISEDARKEARRRRLFKYLVLSGPEFEIEDLEERRARIEQAWKIWESGMKRIGQ